MRRNQAADKRQQWPLELAPSDHRSTKSADGRVATEAAWLNGNNLEKEEIKKTKEKQKNERKALTLTGLLMEGVKQFRFFLLVSIIRRVS